MNRPESGPAGGGSSWAEIVGRILEEARRRAGKGPALALRLEQLGVVGERGERYSESSISNWIRGRAKPPAEVVLAAAQAVGISLDDRLGIGRQASGLEQQLHEVQAELAQQRSNAAALERRLEDLVARFDERGSQPTRSFDRQLDDLTHLNAALAKVGRQLGRRWAGDAVASRPEIEAESQEDLVTRIGVVQARMSEVAGMVGAAFVAYPTEPALPATEDTFREWLANIVPVLRQQMPAIQENADKFSGTTTGSGDRVQEGMR
jgi:transcriptional regulator with XRE-family HTH domain